MDFAKAKGIAETVVRPFNYSIDTTSVFHLLIYQNYYAKQSV